MRYYKQLTKEGKTLFTVSLWGEDGHLEELKEFLEDLTKEVLKDLEE